MASKSLPLLLLAPTLTLLASGCERQAAGAPAARVAASNTYLAAAAQDLLGQGAPILILAQPGQCPGHFDTRPSQIERLRDCRLLIRFDFQSALDRVLSRAVERGPRIVVVNAPGGLCEPETYVATCSAVADALVAENLLDQALADERMASIRARVGALRDWARAEAERASLRDCPAIASRHQVAFCRFLGLSVVGELPPADGASTTAVNTLLVDGAAARVVVANRPEGTGLAQAVAERLAARMAVFDNFPAAPEHGGTFDDLVRSNVQCLLDAAGS